MKRTLFFVAVLAAIASSCNNSKSNQNEYVAPVETSQMETPIVEETPKIEPSASDLVFYDLKGKVRSCSVVTEEYGSTRTLQTFDINGMCTSLADDFDAGFERDEDGRIVAGRRKYFEEMSYTNVYEYDANGRISKASCDAMPDGLAFEHNYNYDEQGRIAFLKGWNDGAGPLTIRYEYIEEDAVGNWTRRIVRVYVDGDEEPAVSTQTRTIEYY